jgi:hypothetical protein
MANREFAISIRQPWATLLVYGHKSIEIRRWPTDRRGRVLIHAAKLPDPRPEVWQRLPNELREAAQLRGGIIGAGVISDCLTYCSKTAFAIDASRHLNDLSWFQKPALYGFVFSNVVVLPFRPYPGWVRFFAVQPAR